jgi:hypothetical protein
MKFLITDSSKFPVVPIRVGVRVTAWLEIVFVVGSGRVRYRLGLGIAVI